MSEKEIAIQGGCRCGAIRYRAKAPHNWAGNCHCDDCRRATGGPYTSWFGVSPENIEISGQKITEYESSPGIYRGFCGNCGSPMTFHGEGWDDLAITIATLDDPNSITPETHVFLKDRLQWVKYNEDFRLYDGMPGRVTGEET